MAIFVRALVCKFYQLSQTNFLCLSTKELSRPLCGPLCHVALNVFKAMPEIAVPLTIEQGLVMGSTE